LNDIQIRMISKETISLITSLKDPIIKVLEDIATEVKFFMDNGLSEYIESTKVKFENTKTFLYRDENVPFYDVFFNVTLKFHRELKKIVDQDDLFAKSNCASIIGNAGSGKTMLIKHFFLNTINSGNKIPIFIELRNLNDYDLSIIDYIYQVLFDNKLSPNQKILERLLNTGEFIFLLDGYDEIYSNRKNKITTDLDRFIDKYSKNNYIVSSRPGSGVESFPRFNNFFVQPLTENEIALFLDTVLKESDDLLLASKIKEVINRQENKDYKNFLSSPLLLSMFILTFNTYPELPRKKSKFYWNVFDTLATKHDSFPKKGGYQHERKTGLQNDEFEQILKWFSYISLFEGKFSFDSQYLTNTLNHIKQALNFTYNTQLLIEDLTLAIAIIIVDGIEYKFPHKSLQEYFCAILIKDQTEADKAKIYTRKFGSQMRFSPGGNDNFWDLCYEVDKTSFIRNFLIRELCQFIDPLKESSSLEISKKLYDTTNFRDRISFDLTGNVVYNGYGYSTLHGSKFKVSKYTNLPGVEILSFRQYSNNPAVKDFFLKNKNRLILDTNKIDYEAYYIKIWSADFENLLLDIGLSEKIKVFIEDVKAKILSFQDQINHEINNTGSLLDIT